MKKLIVGILLVAVSQLSFAYPKQNPFPPFKIAGNLYYVGADDLASYLIVTPKGNILINSDQEEDVPLIKSNVEKLGFKFSDTKVLLVSHVHVDHAGGSKSIQQQTKATYKVMAGDVDVAESGGKTDFHYSNDPEMYLPAAKVDAILHDDEKVELGGTVLTAHLTAGHTKGTTSWSMQVMDRGKPYNVVIVGSLNVNPGYQLKNNKQYPTIAKDFEHSFAELKSLPCDIFLGAHAGYFNLQKKYDLLQTSKTNPFIDPKGYQDHIAQKEKEFNLAMEKAQ